MSRLWGVEFGFLMDFKFNHVERVRVRFPPARQWQEGLQTPHFLTATVRGHAHPNAPKLPQVWTIIAPTLRELGVWKNWGSSFGVLIWGILVILGPYWLQAFQVSFVCSLRAWTLRAVAGIWHVRVAILVLVTVVVFGPSDRCLRHGQGTPSEINQKRSSHEASTHSLQPLTPKVDAGGCAAVRSRRRLSAAAALAAVRARS